ncbi:hypothetical protein VSU19_10225 [Verrucomicrobiales bacterium BCK34]|nr:hypothetical protein [Verrucomicrobiales bacterium BCK34]
MKLEEIIVDWQQDIDDYAEKRWSRNPSDQKAKRYENDVIDEFEDYLKRRGVRVRPNSKGLQIFAEFFRRAKLESLHRDLNRIKSEPIQQHDSDFWKFSPALNVESGIVGSASLPEERTVGQLIEAFMEHRKATGKSPSTIQAYEGHTRVFGDAVGRERTLASLCLEDIESFLDCLAKYPRNVDQRYRGNESARCARKCEVSGRYRPSIQPVCEKLLHDGEHDAFTCCQEGLDREKPGFEFSLGRSLHDEEKAQ